MTILRPSSSNSGLEIFRNIFRKLNIRGRDAKIFFISLLLAFGIWLLHNLSLNYSSVVCVPVKAKCRIEGHSEVSANQGLVQIRCNARGFNLIRLRKAERREPVTVEFQRSDLHFKSGDTFYATSPDFSRHLSAIFGNTVKLEAFVSDTVFFRFPEENYRRVPIIPVYSISYKPQYTNVGGIRMNPDSVTIYGEPSHLSSIDKVFTESLALDNVSSSRRGVARLEKIQGVRLSSEMADYSLEVSRYVEIKASLPVRGRNVPSGRNLVIYPSTAEVTFKCAFPVSSDPASSANVYVDYARFEESLHGQCIPEIDGLPADVIDYKVSPDVFECVESGR